ncbi:MAG: hypothetical protein H6550_07465 [Chitinophagales bacterium]|nr:hypothetical protein [Chitinophagales bacterium]
MNGLKKISGIGGKIPVHVLNSFFLALGYGVAVYILMPFLLRIGMLVEIPDSNNLLNWDAGWYYQIMKEGYHYTEGVASNSAFFPLMPWVWKVLHVGVWGISFANLVFFSVGFACINAIYDLDARTRFLWLTIPSFYFVWIPYTEAMFVMFISLFFLGWVKQKRWLIWLGLFCVSLTRPTTMILAPALLITELITGSNKNWLPALKTFFVDYALPLFGGLAFFIWYEYYATGVWFAFFKQEENWGHKFAWTIFPLNSMYGLRLLWLNAVALFLGLVSLLTLVRLGLLWLFKNKNEDKLFVVSCLYFTGISLVTILFNPIWGTSTTNVYDIHRYALVSPFFWVLLHRYSVTAVYKWYHYVAVLVLSNLFWLAFASYIHREYLLYFNCAGILMMMYMSLATKRIQWMPMALAAINFVVQVFMFQWYLEMIYPG